MNTTTYATCRHCGSSIYAEGDSCPERTTTGQRPMLPCEPVGKTFCRFHGNLHADAESMQTESTDRCIYEVVPR